MNSKNAVAFKVSLGGIITALSVVLMMLAGIMSSLVYVIPMITGLLLMVLVIELGRGFTTLVYVSVSIISILLLANKEAAIMFFGYYPIIKSILEGRFKKAICWLLKFILFNISMIAFYFVTTKIFMISYEDVESFSKYAIWGSTFILIDLHQNPVQPFLLCNRLAGKQLVALQRDVRILVLTAQPLKEL